MSGRWHCKPERSSSGHWGSGNRWGDDGRSRCVDGVHGSIAAVPPARNGLSDQTKLILEGAETSKGNAQGSSKSLWILGKGSSHQ